MIIPLNFFRGIFLRFSVELLSRWNLSFLSCLFGPQALSVPGNGSFLSAFEGRSQGLNFPPDNQGIFIWICRSALPLEFFFLSFFCSNLWALSIFMVAKGGQVT
jgi:hypothetical protein